MNDDSQMKKLSHLAVYYTYTLFVYLLACLLSHL